MLEKKKHLTAQRGCVAGATICKGLDEGGGGWGWGGRHAWRHMGLRPRCLFWTSGRVVAHRSSRANLPSQRKNVFAQIESHPLALIQFPPPPRQWPPRRMKHQPNSHKWRAGRSAASSDVNLFNSRRSARLGSAAATSAEIVASGKRDSTDFSIFKKKDNVKTKRPAAR